MAVPIRPRRLLLLAALVTLGGSGAAADPDRVVREGRDDLEGRARADAAGQAHARPGREGEVRGDPLAHHANLLGRLDGLIHDLQVGPGEVRVALKGGTLYGLIGAAERGTAPKFDDIDLIVTGAKVERVLRAVKRRFRGVDLRRDVTEKPAFLDGVRHLQIALPATTRRAASQLDLAIYEPDRVDEARVLSEPYAGVSFTKLKLGIPRGQPLSSLLRRVTSADEAQHTAELADPDGVGIADLRAGRLRVVPIADQGERLPEGILHILYLTGKYQHFTIARDTRELYAHLDGAAYRAFFSPASAGRERAIVRANYVLSAFRETAGRDLRRVLVQGEQVGLWDKILPGMEVVTGDPQRWRRTLKAVGRAQRLARQRGKGRAWIFGAILSELPTEAAARHALSLLGLPDAAGDDARVGKADILEGYRFFRGERAGPARARHRRPSTAPSEPAPRAAASR